MENTMLYLEKLKASLKTEQNPINRMYLYDLIINWNKVENVCANNAESPISTIVSAVSEYTQYLSQPRFLETDKKAYGFDAEHDVFRPYYLHDIIELLLHSSGITENEQGIVIRNRPFNNSIHLQNDTFEQQTHKPFLELSFSGKYLHVGLEFEFQYRLKSKKNFTKGNLFIPLIVFYIEKCFCEKSFKEIAQLKADMKVLNPNAILFCITEMADKRFMRLYSEIKDIVYVTRASFKSADTLKPLQPQVFLRIFTKLNNFATSELMTYDKYVPFGHVDLYN